MANAIRFRNHDVPKQQGELARLKVVSGPDRGAIYVVTGSPAGIGRGETSDVVLTDLKSSRLHAQLIWMGNGWQVKDMGSSNGVRHNGKEVKLSPVVSGDTVALGETVLEFVGADAGAQALVAAPKTTQNVQAEQMAMLSQQDRIKAITSFGGIGKAVAQNAPSMPDATESPNKAKKLMMFALMVLGAVVFLVPDEKAAKKKKTPEPKASDASRDLAAYLPKGYSAEVSKTVQTFFRSGFREFREGNYLRAQSQFETVLQIDGSHSLARIYLSNSKKAIEEEVKTHLTLGKQDYYAGKLQQAKGHYEAVLRLLYKDQSNQAFTESKDQLEKLKTILKEDS